MKILGQTFKIIRKSHISQHLALYAAKMRDYGLCMCTDAPIQYLQHGVPHVAKVFTLRLCICRGVWILRFSYTLCYVECGFRIKGTDYHKTSLEFHTARCEMDPGNAFRVYLMSKKVTGTERHSITIHVNKNRSE